MAATVLPIEPTSFVAGDTVKFTKSLDDYSAADGWTLSYEFRGAGVLTVDATTDTDGVGFAVTIPAAQTSPLAAGQYQWTARVSLDGEVFTVARGVVAIAGNPAKMVAGDGQSSTERSIANLNAKIERLAAEDNEAYSIGQRAATRQKIGEAMHARGILTAQLCRENGGRPPSHAMVFLAPS